ncbi:hypothetical protein IWX49DRAFT_554487 [Phyllosticta citricarpa]
MLVKCAQADDVVSYGRHMYLVTEPPLLSTRSQLRGVAHDETLHRQHLSLCNYRSKGLSFAIMTYLSQQRRRGCAIGLPPLLPHTTYTPSLNNHPLPTLARGSGHELQQWRAGEDPVISRSPAFLIDTAKFKVGATLCVDSTPLSAHSLVWNLWPRCQGKRAKRFKPINVWRQGNPDTLAAALAQGQDVDLPERVVPTHQCTLCVVKNIWKDGRVTVYSMCHGDQYVWGKDNLSNIDQKGNVACW